MRHVTRVLFSLSGWPYIQNKLLQFNNSIAIYLGLPSHRFCRVLGKLCFLFDGLKLLPYLELGRNPYSTRGFELIELTIMARP